MAVDIFGIRHHGPGSARSMLRALETLKPDVILVEGPPEAEALISLAAHQEMVPPVALLVYVPENPRRAVYYPFAEFSPEWQAIHYGTGQSIPLRFIDLPQAHRFALEPEPEAQLVVEADDAPNQDTGKATDLGTDQNIHISDDPFRLIAQATGYTDCERWWEQLVEQRTDSTELFAAIQELMTALRTETGDSPPGNLDDASIEPLREAYMRQCIRAAVKEGYERIAVVCGAWHGPALASMPAAKADADLLKGLPKTKTSATWIPWTNDRLTSFSGYGAGVDSPEYYQTLWSHPQRVAVRWMGLAAHLLREADLDASPASVIEAVRLADALAAMRGRSLPGLPELLESAQSTFCGGSETPMRLIMRKLVVGERLGTVPAECPTIPLQEDIGREQRRLRLSPEAQERLLDLDLRKPNEMDRSRLLHRMALLGIHWGLQENVYGKSGTFHEMWRLRWEPELSIKVIEAGIWGTTVLTAATTFARDRTEKITSLAELTALVEKVLLADLPDAIASLLTRLDALAGITSDIPVLMDAISPLASAARYGNVRSVNVEKVQHVIDGLVTRICIGLPASCSSLNDEAAVAVVQQIASVNQSLSILRKEDLLTMWQSALARLADQRGMHGLVAGRCCRLSLESQAWTSEEVARRMGLALSRANPSHDSGAWVEGFLHGSGLVLLHREDLWNLLDGWVSELAETDFDELLPIVRRTFSTFSRPERRQMGERVAGGRRFTAIVDTENEIDTGRAQIVLPTLARLLGLSFEEATT